MKTGKSLTELAKTLEDIRDNSRDFLVPATKLGMTETGTLAFENGSRHEFTPTEFAHDQLSEYSEVPRGYYRRLKEENPLLLSKNVNHGFAMKSQVERRDGKAETRMVRTYRDGMRAMLSSSYRRLDSYDLCQEILPMLADNRMEVVSTELTDQHLYLKALMPTLKSEIKVGDVVQYGIVISNSDVGAGALRVEPLIFRLVCKNGMISSTAIKKFHAGRNLAGEDIMELLSVSTQQLTDQAFWAQVRDIVSASLRPEVFQAEIERIKQAADTKITNFDIPQVVELAMAHSRVDGKGVKENIIQYLANGADGAGLTKWGLVNGFTHAAQSDQVNYERSIELERAGAKVLNLDVTHWRRIAEAS